MKAIRLLCIFLPLLAMSDVLHAQGWPERTGCRGQNPFSPDWLETPTETHVYKLGEHKEVNVHMTGGMPVYGYDDMGFTVRTRIDDATYDQRIVCGTWADEYSIDFDWIGPVGRITIDFELLDIESRDPLQSDLVVNEGVTYEFSPEAHRWRMMHYYRSMPAKPDQESRSACVCQRGSDEEGALQCLPADCEPNSFLFPEEDVRVDSRSSP